jgi:hypothetical protein
MTILSKFDEQGGFLAGDTETGRTAYAHPSSSWANFAHRSRPGFVARRMMVHENACSYIWRDAEYFAAKDRKRMDDLRRALAELMP